MNIKRIITILSQKYPSANIVKNDEINASEIICELGSGKAIAVIDRSKPHYHNKMTESYVVLEGDLEVYINNEKKSLKAGDMIIINPGEVHYAIGNETWIEVMTNPPWSPEDHILI